MTERISSLVDGEIDRDELTAAYQSLDAGNLRTVERYQLIGAVMRGDCSEAAVRLCRDDFSARISEKIADQPRWLLPVAKHRRRAAPPRRGSAFVGGFAAAAAIAAVAVMVAAPNWLRSPGAVPEPLASADNVVPSAAPAMDMDELNALLVEHGEFTGSAGLNGLVSYAKFVSHGSE